MRLVIPLLLLGALAFDLCLAQVDYPVFRRARIRTEEEDSQEVGQISQQRARKYKVRIRPRPTVITAISGEDDSQQDVSLEAVPQTLHVVRQPQLIPQEPVRLVTASPYQTRSRGTSPQPPPAVSSVARERKEPVQAIRNFSNINQDGSFTFGYEAADGSFKEETRGIDCVVRGKYGYIDPQGVRREFSYVSGNPCDPNAADEEEEEEEPLPQRAYPRRPVSTVAPQLVTHAQRLEQVLEEQVPQNQLPEIYRQYVPAVPVTRRPQVLTTTHRPRPLARPSVLAVNSLSVPQPLPQPVAAEEPTTYRPSIRLRYPSSTVTPTFAAPTTRGLTTTARGLTTRAPTRATTRQPVSSTTAGSIFAFDYDVTQDHVYQNHPAYAIPAAVPQTLLPRPSPSDPPRSQVNIALPGAAHLGPQTIYHTGAAPVQLLQPQPIRPHFQQPQPVRQVPVQKRRKTTATTTTTAKPTPAEVIQRAQEAEQPSQPVYTSELVFDPNTGQYTTVLLHQLPRTNHEVHLNHRLQAFVQPPSPAPTVILRSQAQPPPGHHLGNFVQQPHHLQYQPAGLQQYYVTSDGRPNGASGQIDHFLRNYNVPF